MIIDNNNIFLRLSSIEYVENKKTDDDIVFCVIISKYYLDHHQNQARFCATHVTRAI